MLALCSTAVCGIQREAENKNIEVIVAQMNKRATVYATGYGFDSIRGNEIFNIFNSFWQGGKARS